eukprot:6505287-Alexandrium_andersonii.AAC.1
MVPTSVLEFRGWPSGPPRAGCCARMASRAAAPLTQARTACRSASAEGPQAGPAQPWWSGRSAPWGAPANYEAKRELVAPALGAKVKGQ